MNAIMAMPTQTRRSKPEKRLGPLHEPAAFVDGPNQYQYVGGDPVGAVDPGGLDTIWPGKPQYVPTADAPGASSGAHASGPVAVPAGTTLAMFGWLDRLEQELTRESVVGYPMLPVSAIQQEIYIDSIADEIDDAVGIHGHYWDGGGRPIRLGDDETRIIRNDEATATLRARVASLVAIQLRAGVFAQGTGSGSQWVSGGRLGVGSCQVAVDYAWRRTPEGGAKVTAFYSVQDRFTFRTFDVQWQLSNLRMATAKQSGDYFLWAVDFAVFIPVHGGLTWGEPFDMFTCWTEFTDVPCQAQSGGGGAGGAW